MPCSTCGHTMQKVTEGTFWCPRCGTLGDAILNKQTDEYDLQCEAPKLVERCRRFDPTQGAAEGLYQWRRLGIEESINPPAARPTGDHLGPKYPTSTDEAAMGGGPW
jgi:hypothetical protein